MLHRLGVLNGKRGGKVSTDWLDSGVVKNKPKKPHQDPRDWKSLDDPIIDDDDELIFRPPGWLINVVILALVVLVISLVVCFVRL
jgi:hypothetical protein